MNLAYSIKVNSKKMQKLKKEYTVMKTKEQEDMVELKVVYFFIYCVENLF